ALPPLPVPGAALVDPRGGAEARPGRDLECGARLRALAHRPDGLQVPLGGLEDHQDLTRYLRRVPRGRLTRLISSATKPARMRAPFSWKCVPSTLMSLRRRKKSSGVGA